MSSVRLAPKKRFEMSKPNKGPLKFDDVVFRYPVDADDEYDTESDEMRRMRMMIQACDVWWSSRLAGKDSTPPWINQKWEKNHEQ